MPHGKDGRPFEALLNPLGIISRTNPAQMVEAALGKIAERTGTPYVVHDFDPNTNLTMFAKQELARHGMTDTETIVDPATGREIPNIFTGNRFLMKLHHTAEGKSDSRSTGSYSSEGAPTKGAGGNSKRLSLMDMNALLSHGATSVIREAGAIRGQASPDYWQQVMSGYDPPAPREPVVYAKFLDMLRASGINPVREGTKLHLMALTDRDVETLAGNRHPENAETVDWKAGLKPIKGGLFSPDLVGDGSRWAAIPLHEPMPSPAFEEPIRRLLGLTEKRFRDVLAGREALGDHGTGPGGLKSALTAIDLDQAIAQARADFKAGRASTRDAAARKLGYLKTAKRQGLHPADWIWSKVPVLPAKFRPVSVMAGSGLPMVSDANVLYKEVFDANDNLRELSGQVEDTGAEREALYDAIKGVVGLGDPIHPKNQERQVKGILRSVFAHSPKYGMIQRKLIGSSTDLVGRAVIAPDPDLGMDEIGLPEASAWETYRPFVVRRLVRGGVPRLRAARAVADREPMARKALLEETQSRPVLVNRAPTLHRYSIMALRPRLVTGDTLRLPPLVYKGMGADNDGDAVNYHVLASEDASREALEKMLPSKNLLSAADFKAHQLPSQEYVSGLFNASTLRDDHKPARRFATSAEAVAAYRRGELSVGDPVDVLDDR
jgi:hypothetical protein